MDTELQTTKLQNLGNGRIEVETLQINLSGEGVGTSDHQRRRAPAGEGPQGSRRQIVELGVGVALVLVFRQLRRRSLGEEEAIAVAGIGSPENGREAVAGHGSSVGGSDCR